MPVAMSTRWNRGALLGLAKSAMATRSWCGMAPPRRASSALARDSSGFCGTGGGTISGAVGTSRPRGAGLGLARAELASGRAAAAQEQAACQQAGRLRP